MAEFDSEKYPSLPLNYVTIAHLQEQWLKEKQRKQQENEEKEQYPVHQNRIVNGKNHSVKGWHEVAKEPKLKEVKSSARVVEESLDGIRGKKNRKMGYFGKRKAWVERDGSRDMARVSISDVSEKEMMNVENGGEVSCKGKCKEVEEVGTVCALEVVGESNVDREIEGKKCGIGFWEKEHSWRKMGGAVGEVSEKGDSVEQSGRGRNGEKEKVLVDGERFNEKVRMGGAFCAYGDMEVGSVCTVEVVGESDVDRESAGERFGVGYKGKKSSWGGMGDGVGGDSVEQSGQESNGEKEKVSIEMEGKTNEKVRVSDAFRAYGDKEVEEVANVCVVEMVEENEEDREITGQEHRVGFRGKKHSWKKIDDRVRFRGKKLGWRKIGDRAGEVSVKADSPLQSEQECNAENEEVSVDVKEGTNEKVKVRGVFCAYSDKSIYVPLIDSEASLKMKNERDLGNLSLSNRRYGHGRSSVGMYDDKRRYASSRRYEPRTMLKQRDNSFVWVKKGESSNGNVAEIETQVDFSSQSTSQSKLCSQ